MLVPKYSKADGTFAFAGNVTIGETNKGNCRYGFEVKDLGTVSSSTATTRIEDINWETHDANEAATSYSGTTTLARKGAYSIKFWTGEEDYRWQVLRQNKHLSNRFAWAMFDLFFISIYQNALVLTICLPALACMESNAPLGAFDYVAFAGAFEFLLLEAIADEQQMAFHTTKRKLLSEGKKLEELPEPFNKGFNTTGLWGYCRHPNYLGEQGMWLLLYLVTIGAGVTTYGIFHWSMVGPLFLIFLFLGSSAFQEGVSSGKYPEYKLYLAHVMKYLPLWKYRPEKYKEEK